MAGTAAPVPNLGSIETASGGTASWFENASAASMHASLQDYWTLTGWFKVRDDSSTAALIEYASSSTVTAASVLSMMGVYRLANGNLRFQFDRSTSSLGYFHDFPTSIGSAPFFMGLVKDRPASGTASPTYTLYVDDAHVFSTGFVAHGLSTSGENGRWVLGASRRWGTAEGATPAFATVGVRADDVCFFTRSMSAPKIKEIYRNGLRSWSEKGMFESNSQRFQSRVLVEDGDGQMIDLSALYGVNWVKSADVQESVEEIINRATVVLQRYMGQSLNLSPLSTTSALNQNAAAEFEALLELRRRVRVECAVVPNEWRVQGWEWEPLFDGYIDELSWQSDTVTIAAADKMVILEDTFQLEPKAYNYYSGPVTSETHIQSVINDNVPMVLTGSSTLVFGYTGGTPELYTPASTGWVLNYDDAAAAPVSQLVTAVADQIGWTVRYKWYDPTQEYRLTYFAPPRLKKIDIESIAEDGNGYTTIVTRTPHGLTEEQSITIAGTTNYNGATTVDAVLAYNEFRTLQTPSGTPATETSGYLTYGSHATLGDDQVISYEALRKNARDIRNAAIVKYNRVPGETATMPVTNVGGGSGAPIQVTLKNTDPSFSRTVAQLQVGQTFEVFGCPDANANVKDTISSIVNGSVVIGSVNIAAALSATSAGFQSEYLKYKAAYSFSTPSITKYGLRQAAVFEASNGNINTATEALSLASAIVSDLAEPTADIAVRIHCAPWFELHDLITLRADRKQRWTSDLQAAVVGVNHHLEGANSYTNLTLRSSTSASVSAGASPTNGAGWIWRNVVSPARPAITDKMEATTDLNIIGAQLGGKLGRQFSWNTKAPFHQHGQGRTMLRADFFEVHLSTDPDFIPDETTIAHAGRGT